MFRAVPMMRMRAIVLSQDERAVLKRLGQLGAVQLTRTRPAPDTELLAPTDHTGELAQYERIRARVQDLRQSLEIPPLSSEPVLKEMTLSQAEAILFSLEQHSSGLLENRQRITQRQKELSAIYEKVSSYRGFDIPLTGLDRYSFLHFVTGTLPVQNLEDLGKEVGDKVALLPLAEQKGRQSLFAVTTRQGQQILEKALQKAGFQHEALPVIEGGTVDGLSEETEREQAQLKAELEQLSGRIKAIAVDFALPLAEIERFTDIECQLLEASQKFPRTETTILITGWIPASDIEVVKQNVGEITGGRYVLETTPPDALTDGEAPVLLRHSWVLRPFEMLVSSYGLPDYRELEPTLFVALSYIVMFGMMFGDAGHGMVLCACGLMALVKGRSLKIRDMGVLLLFAGASSIIFGIVYGSYFGIEVLKKYALWHDPLEGDPIQLMYGAIGIGIGVISLGLICNVINRFRKGDIIGGILDKFGLVGLLFYWGTLVLLIYGATIRSWGLMGTCAVLFLVVPIVGWSLKEPLEHFMRQKSGHHSETGEGMGAAIIESCVGAFEAILSYLANTISFVRLAAYAMSHAALLFAAFMLAEEVKDFPYGGGFWGILIIILGNLIAIVLEGVIASVQALRLEYYEFFGKFFSGSGQPFEPFRLAENGKDTKQ